jgi:cbb3-type cytochrome oxidase subunit 1
MAWMVIGWALVLIGVTGFVVGLRRSRRNDEVERGLLLWMTLAWVGVALLVGTEIA